MAMYYGDPMDGDMHDQDVMDVMMDVLDGSGRYMYENARSRRRAYRSAAQEIRANRQNPAQAQPAEPEEVPSGHDIKLFLPGQKFLDRVTCAICFNVFREPYTCESLQQEQCGHSFCRACIEKAFRVGGRRECPTCRARVLKLNRNMMAKQMIDEFDVRCKNSKEMADDASESPGAAEQKAERESKDGMDEGVDDAGNNGQQPEGGQGYCEWTGTFGQLASHMKNCEFVEKECKYSKMGCQYKGSPTRVATHHTDAVQAHLKLVEAELEKQRKEFERKEQHSEIRISVAERALDEQRQQLTEHHDRRMRTLRQQKQVTIEELRTRIGELNRQVLRLREENEEKFQDRRGGRGHKRARRSVPSASSSSSSSAASPSQRSNMYTTRLGDVYSRDDLSKFLQNPRAILEAQKRNDIMFGIVLMLKADGQSQEHIKRRLTRWIQEHFNTAHLVARGRTSLDKRHKELDSMIRRVFTKNLQFK